MGGRTREIFIGGLKGNKKACDKEVVIALTRAMHGLRPKALLVFALQILAGVWGVTRLRAVSDSDAHLQALAETKTVAASYDEWWVESGGQLAEDGIFDLPTESKPNAHPGLTPRAHVASAAARLQSRGNLVCSNRAREREIVLIVRVVRHDRRSCPYS